MELINQRTKINGKVIHIPAYNVEGTLYPRLRPILEALQDVGVRFSWDDANKTVEIWTV